jgi:uncharacterized membrane protein YGL010W
MQVVEDAIPVPERDAPWEEKLSYYRSQHRTAGCRATHLVGIPTVAAAMPISLVRPKLGLPLFAAGWALQVAGHKLFEHNSPALTKGVLTYQLCGLAFWCEEMGDLIAGRSPFAGRSLRREASTAA